MKIFFRTRDQTTLAILLLIAGSALIPTWVGTLGSARQTRSGFSGIFGHKIDFDQTAPRTFQLQIDINRDRHESLIVLPGIGPGLAARIDEDRRKCGPFASPDDLVRVHGIGPKKLEGIRKFITTSADSAHRKWEPNTDEPTSR